MAFLDRVFPRDIAAHVTGGPERRVDIVSLASGAEERNARWKNSRRSFDAGFAIRCVDDLAQVVAMFEEAGGPLHSFRFRDWTDFSSAATSTQNPTPGDQILGQGDGITTTFQLAKIYGALVPYTRTITKPIPGSVVLALDGVPQGSGWGVDNLTGLISFTAAPASGVEITAGFLFDVPVRFNAQQLALDLAFFSEDDGHGSGNIPSIPLIEVLE